MRMILNMILVSGALALAACGSDASDKLADRVEDAGEARADVIEDKADVLRENAECLTQN